MCLKPTSKTTTTNNTSASVGSSSTTSNNKDNDNTNSMMTALRPRNKLSLLLSSSSFHCTIDNEDSIYTDYKKTDNDVTTTTVQVVPPAKKSVYLTIATVVLLLIASEQLHRFLITHHLSSLHPLFNLESNRFILARHLGVDTVACLAIALLGYKNKHLLYDICTFQRHAYIQSTIQNRIYGYQPESHRLLLLFIAYQVKNTFDSYYWNDGIIYIAHHIFAGLTAWLGMYPGLCGIYAVFFMGISEISTCVLCLLANFDPHFGIDGLDVVLPNTKIVLAIAFVILFILCRVLIWPLFSYHFIMDCKMMLDVLQQDNNDDDDDDDNDKDKTVTRKPSTMDIGTMSRKLLGYNKSHVRYALKFMMFTNIGLTALQILWLGEIIVTAKQEIEALL